MNLHAGGSVREEATQVNAQMTTYVHEQIAVFPQGFLIHALPTKVAAALTVERNTRLM